MKKLPGEFWQLVVIACFFSATMNLKAATFTVTTTGDTGPGSLREAVTALNATGGSHVINFSVTGRITLITPLPAMSNNVVIHGPIGTPLIISGAGPLLRFAPGTTNFVQRLILADGITTNANGNAYGGGILNEGVLQIVDSVVSNNVVGAGARSRAAGGGIYNSGDLTILTCSIVNNRVEGATFENRGGGIAHILGKLTIVNSLMASNSASGGGGIAAAGPFNMTNVTVSNNRAGSGAGISTGNESRKATIVNSTIAFNSSPSGRFDVFRRGGGIVNSTWSVELINTIVASNIGYDLSGYCTSQGFNLIGDTWGSIGLSTNDYRNVSPGIGPLQDNGGPTLTHALLPGSLAIDNGTSDRATATDQRGVARPWGYGIDIGAFEYQTRTNPIVIWNNPENIIYGTPLGPTQLNAAAQNTSGTFSYNPPSGTIMPARSNQIITAVFTPSDPFSFYSATNTVLIYVLKADQTISFPTLQPRRVSDAPFSLVATATSGLPVSFSILSGPASLSGNTVFPNGTPGLVTIRASQSGNTNFNAAADVDNSFLVTALPVLINPRLAADNRFSMTVSLDTGTRYRVQGSTNLSSWVDLTNFVSSRSAFQFISTNSPTQNRGFYRLVSP